MNVECGIIVAMSHDRVIGLQGKIPWDYPDDLQRFKRITIDSAIIMGRLTWESLPQKPLPRRRNIVITRHTIKGIDCFRDIPAALASVHGKVWFIGGARIFAEAMPWCDIMDITYVPEVIEHPEAVYFPQIDPTIWQAEVSHPLTDPSPLRQARYRRIPAHSSAIEGEFAPNRNPA